MHELFLYGLKKYFKLKTYFKWIVKNKICTFSVECCYFWIFLKILYLIIKLQNEHYFRFTNNKNYYKQLLRNLLCYCELRIDKHKGKKAFKRFLQKKNSSKANVSAEDSKRKWFCLLLLYLTNIIELYVRFLCNKRVKIKYAHFSVVYFIIQPHIRLTWLKDKWRGEIMHTCQHVYSIVHL